MNIVPLKKLTTLISSGSTPRGGAKVYLSKGSVMLIRSQNVLMRNLSLEDVAYITDEIASNMKRTIVHDNDVLLNITGASIGRVACIEDQEVKANVNQHVCILRTDPNSLHYRYLMHFLAQPSFQARINSKQNGGTRQALTFEQIKQFQIPLPPLEEQKRIAAILDKADAIRRRRKEAIALTEELLRSTFLDMFGDPVTNPKGWEVVPMRDVISQIEAGWSAKGEERHRDDDEWGVLKISAVTSGVFKPREHKAVNSPTFKKDPVIPQKGDLLFSRANTRELVAATCLVEKDCEKVFLPDKLWRIKTNPKFANVEYLRFLLADPRYRSLLARKATGTSGSMLNVSQAKLLDMDSPVPDINTQTKFADVLWRIYKLKERTENSLENLNINFNSLLQKAFRGEL